VDHIADRIDTGIQQTVNPVVGQLSQNVRDTLGIWNRPFSPLSSSHPKPASSPPQANPLNDGIFLFFFIYLLFVLSNKRSVILPLFLSFLFAVHRIDLTIVPGFL